MDAYTTWSYRYPAVQQRAAEFIPRTSSTTVRPYSTALPSFHGCRRRAYSLPSDATGKFKLDGLFIVKMLTPMVAIPKAQSSQLSEPRCISTSIRPYDAKLSAAGGTVASNGLSSALPASRTNAGWADNSICIWPAAKHHQPGRPKKSAPNTREFQQTCLQS